MSLLLNRRLISVSVGALLLNNLAGQTMEVTYDTQKDAFHVVYNNPSKGIAINKNLFVFNLVGESPAFIHSDSSIFVFSRIGFNTRMQYELLQYRFINNDLVFQKRIYFDEYDIRIYSNSKIVSQNNKVSIIFTLNGRSDVILTIDPLTSNPINNLPDLYKLNRQKFLPEIKDLIIPKQH